jgi:hypothetical protein
MVFDRYSANFVQLYYYQHFSFEKCLIVFFLSFSHIVSSVIWTYDLMWARSVQFRDAVRLFVKGTDGTVGSFAECLCGSPHLYKV